MAGIVRVAVDGQDGIVLAQNTGLRFVDVDTDLALVVVSLSGQFYPFRCTLERHSVTAIKITLRP